MKCWTLRWLHHPPCVPLQVRRSPWALRQAGSLLPLGHSGRFAILIEHSGKLIVLLMGPPPSLDTQTGSLPSLDMSFLRGSSSYTMVDLWKRCEPFFIIQLVHANTFLYIYYILAESLRVIAEYPENAEIHTPPILKPMSTTASSSSSAKFARQIFWILPIAFRKTSYLKTYPFVLTSHVHSSLNSHTHYNSHICPYVPFITTNTRNYFIQHLTDGVIPFYSITYHLQCRFRSSEEGVSNSWTTSPNDRMFNKMWGCQIINQNSLRLRYASRFTYTPFNREDPFVQPGVFEGVLRGLRL